MKPETIKSTCILDMTAPDGRTVFEAGKSYAHCKTSDLALKGENGIVMFMNNARYNNHFKS